MADTHGAQQLVLVTDDGDGVYLRGYEHRHGHWEQVIMRTAAYIGAGGFSGSVSEETVASPIGFFGLTTAFGNAGDPGSGLPYRQVQYGDVWVDDPASPNYNTMQTDDADGSKGTGERLWEIRPEYDYSVVIDYNRFPVQPGAGSAFFVHVANGQPTAGCVAVPAETMVALLQWIDPAKQPRIAMGPLQDVLAM